MNHLINEQEVLGTWAPIIESSTGVNEKTKLDWMSKYAHYHKLYEDQHNIVHLNPNMNVSGMGAVTLPGDPGSISGFSSQATGSGDKPVEHLVAGDMIATKDNGMQTIRWVGSVTVPATGDFAPIMIQKGAMGNARNLRVSQQHRMLFEGWKAELLFGEREVLVAAKYLVNQDTIYVSEGETVEYFHILFDTHQIIFANGTPLESFHPGKLTIEELAKETRKEIYNLFPELQKIPGAYGSVVRTSLKKHEAKVLSENPDFLSYKSNHHPTINL